MPTVSSQPGTVCADGASVFFFLARALKSAFRCLPRGTAVLAPDGEGGGGGVGWPLGCVGVVARWRRIERAIGVRARALRHPRDGSSPRSKYLPRTATGIRPIFVFVAPNKIVLLQKGMRVGRSSRDWEFAQCYSVPTVPFHRCQSRTVCSVVPLYGAFRGRRLHPMASSPDIHKPCRLSFATQLHAFERGVAQSHDGAIPQVTSGIPASDRRTGPFTAT